MALTRPRASQINTVITNVTDPLIVLNNGSTVANIDIGFVMNRNNGTLPNVALFWDESANTFVASFTTSNGTTNANVVISEYANVRAKYFIGDGSQLSNIGGYGNTQVAAYLPTHTGNVNASNVIAGTLYGNIGGGSVLSNVYITGSLIPTTNVAYDLGTPTLRFRDGYFSGNTIYIGSERMSVDSNGRWSFTSGGVAVNLGHQEDFNPPSINASGNVRAAHFNFPNGVSIITTLTSAIDNANTGLKGYVDGQVSTLTANAGAQAGSITTIFANLGAVSGSLATLTANAGAQAGSIATLTSNAAAQSGDIATIFANLGAVSGSISSLTANAAAQAGDITTLYTNAGIQSGAIVSANVGMKGYVDAAVATVSGNANLQFESLASLTANAAVQAGDIATLFANAGAQAGSIATLTANAAVQAGDIATIFANLGSVSGSLATLTANAAAQAGDIATLFANAGAQAGAIVTANTAMKGYVDGQITSLVNGAPSTLDTLNELASALGNDANLSVTITNQIANVNSNITTANSAMKGYVDGQISTVNSNWQANAAVQAGNIATIFANLGSVSGSLATLTANAGAQAGSIATLTSNAAVQAGDIATLFANAGAQAGAIVTSNTAMKGYVDSQIASAQYTDAKVAAFLPNNTANVQAGNLTVTSLTANRIPFVSTGGLIRTSANLVYQNNGIRIVGDPGSEQLHLEGGGTDIVPAELTISRTATNDTQGSGPAIRFQDNGNVNNIRYFQVGGGNWQFIANRNTWVEDMRLDWGGNLKIFTNTVSTSTSTGALQVAGGVGIAGNLWVGNVTATNFTYANGQSILVNIDSALSTLTANAGIQSGDIATLFANAGAQAGSIATLTSNAAVQAGNIATIFANLGSVSGSLATLTANAGAQSGDLATLFANAGAQAGSIATLTSNAAAQAGEIANLWANAGVQAGAIVTANTAMKGYVDGQITNLVNGAPATLDTLNELAAALGNDANLSVTLTNRITSAEANITAANTAMKGYVDGQISTVNSNWQANAAVQAGNIATLFSNAAVQAGDIATLFANAGAQAGSIATLTANAAVQAGDIATLFANAGAQAGIISSLTNYSNANVTSYLPTHSANVGATNINASNSVFVNENVIVTGNVATANLLITNRAVGIRVGNLRLIDDGSTVRLQVSSGPFNIETPIGANITMSTSGGFTRMPAALVTDSTASTSTTTGAFRVSGGAGIAGNVWAGNVIATNFTYANGQSILTNIDSALSTLTANAGAQAGSIATLTSNAASQAGDIATIFANLGAVSGSLATLTANAGAQAGQIASAEANITTANSAMKGYVDGQISSVNSAWQANAGAQAGDIATLFANAGAQAGSIATLTSNAAVQAGDIATLFANAGAQAGSIATLTSNAAVQAGDIATLFANAGAQSGAIVTANTAMKGYVDGQISTVNSSISTANTAMKGYVDGQITSIINGAPSTLDTLNELAAALGNDANLSVSITNQIANVNSNITTANTAMKGYVDSQVLNANTGLKGYVDGYIGFASANANSQQSSIGALNNSVSALSGDIVTLYANAGAQAGSIATLTSNAAAQAGDIATLFANAGVQAGNIATIFANLGAVSGSLATLTANAGTQAGQIASAEANITTANTAMKGYVDGQISTVNSNWQANAAVQAGNIATIFANLGSVSGSLATLTSNAAAQAGDIGTIFANLGAVSGSLATLTANAGAQAGSLATLTANAAAQAGDISTLFANAGAQSGSIATLNTTKANLSGAVFTGGIYATELWSTQSSGDEGGQLNLAPAATNTTVSGNVVIDVYQNRLRIYESGGTNRGGYYDITALSTGVGTNLAAGGGGGGNTSPGGSDGQVQFNNSGSFSGAGSLYYYSGNGVVLASGGIASTSTTSGTFQVAGGIGVTGNVWTDQVYTTNNNNGRNIRIGDDAWLGDVNLADTTQLMGAQNGNNGYLRFGNVGTETLGRAGSGPLTWTGTFTAANINSDNLNYANGTSVITTLSTAISTANTAMKGYVDAINSTLTANAGAQAGSIATLTSNAAVQAGDIATLFANAGAQSASIATLQGNITTLTSNAAAQAGDIATLFANAGAQAGSIATLTSNAAVQAGDIATLFANAGAQAGSIATLTSNAAAQAGSISDLYTIKANILNPTFTNNVTVQGNLIISGNLITTNVDNLQIDDSLIYMAENNPTDFLDIGIVGSLTRNSLYQHTGIVRDATDGIWKFFANVEGVPTSTIDFGSATYSPVQAGNIIATGNVVVGANLRLSGALLNSAGSAGTNGQYLTSTGNGIAWTSIDFSTITDGGTSSVDVNGGYVNVTIGGSELASFSSSSVAVTGNVSADYFTGNGSLLTGIISDYGNTQVGAYLPTHTGNIGASGVNATNLTGTLLTASQPNITSVGTLGSLSVTANVSAANVTSTFGLWGTIRTPSQTSITGVGTITTGTWNAGTVTSNGTITASAATGRVQLGVDAGGSITLGRLDGAASTPYFDFNTSATAVDYDVRIMASGNVGTVGRGNLTITAGNVVMTSADAFFNDIFINSGNNATAIVNSGTAGVGNIGASGAGFNTVFARATSAQYADLAEIYTSDREYVPGTVLIFGGEREVTVSTESHDPRVAGVVSTNPAYIMNNSCDGVEVALQGRVPTKVQGPVSKGDRLVTSSVQGAAERLDMTKYQPGCIIGKALEDIADDSIKTIEVVVGRV